VNKRTLFTFSVQLLITLIFVLLLEICLSFFYGKNERYFIWKPGLEYEYNFKSKYMNNISEFVHVKINKVGARSEDITSRHKEKIITIGGSTTECNTIDQPLTWTEIVQGNLSINFSKQFWVGNFGKSATESHHHILQTEELFKNDKLNDVKTVMYLVGFNDALKSLRHPKRYLNTPIFDLKLKGFMVIPDRDLPFYKRLAIYKFLKHRKFLWGIKVYDSKTFDKEYEKRKAKKDHMIWQENLPNLEKHIARYKENIESLIAINVKNNKKPIFITQPVIWKESLDSKYENFLVFNTAESKIYSTKSLAKLMFLFNNALIEVCKKNNVSYIDLARYSNEKWFYDDCHFNLNGAKKVGEIISKELNTILVN